jgi:hypothetical protein
MDLLLVIVCVACVCVCSCGTCVVIVYLLEALMRRRSVRLYDNCTECSQHFYGTCYSCEVKTLYVNSASCVCLCSSSVLESYIFYISTRSTLNKLLYMFGSRFSACRAAIQLTGGQPLRNTVRR